MNAGDIFNCFEHLTEVQLKIRNRELLHPTSPKPRVRFTVIPRDGLNLPDAECVVEIYDDRLILEGKSVSLRWPDLDPMTAARIVLALVLGRMRELDNDSIRGHEMVSGS